MNGTFGGRFDDPDAQYRVLYGSSQRIGCFLETLARFRPDITLLAALADIGGDNDFVPCGVVPLQWLEQRLLGSAKVQGSYADIGASDWLGHLRIKFARKIVEMRNGDFDAALLQRPTPRGLTQVISQAVNQRGLSGIRYLSRYGHDVENWAIFEPFAIETTGTVALKTCDSDFQTALRIHGLQMSG